MVSSLNHLCVESGEITRTLVNGDHLESKLAKHYHRQNGNEHGTWTCTDEDGFITEITGAAGRNARYEETDNLA